MTKQDMKWLEKMFEGEITAAIEGTPLSRLVCSKSKHVKDMAERRLCELEKVQLGGRFPMVIEGWVLTHYGRFEYCTNC